MKVPVIATTQYSERMGPIVPSVLEHLPQKTAIIDKLTFSAAAGDQFTTELAQLGREHIIVCGLETHICVCQTALDLAHLDYRVHCAIDAVSSRTIEQHSLGVDRMRDCGIFSVGSEAAVMEMLYSAENDDFRSILKLIK